MRENLKYISNILLVLASTLLIASLQTTIWYQFFDFSPPLFWLPIIVYLSLYRKTFEGILIVYLLSLVLYTLTIVNIGLLLFNFATLYLIFYFFKNHIFLTGMKYFFICNCLATVAFQFNHLLFSILFGEFTHLLFWDRLLQLIITPLSAFPIYYLLSKIDQVTDREPLIEMGKSNL